MKIKMLTNVMVEGEELYPLQGRRAHLNNCFMQEDEYDVGEKVDDVELTQSLAETFLQREWAQKIEPLI